MSGGSGDRIGQFHPPPEQRGMGLATRRRRFNRQEIGFGIGGAEDQKEG